MENVRRKMVRLQLVSAGVMLVMLMAVLGAIVYKLTRRTGRAEAGAAGLERAAMAPGSAIAALRRLPVTMWRFPAHRLVFTAACAVRSASIVSTSGPAASSRRHCRTN